VTFVEVEPGVRLEVLDWGGADTPQTMVLLTGLGDNAHVYDHLHSSLLMIFMSSGLPAEDFFHPASRNKAMTSIPGYAMISRSLMP